MSGRKKKTERREVEVIARGVCVKGGRLLVCHSKGASNTYLPGGHVDFMERAADSLVREIREEMGRGAKAGRFLGGVEHSFVQDGVRHSEVNLVFELEIEGVDSARIPPSKESHIEFCWVPLGELPGSNLEPWPLRETLAKWLDPSFKAERWASSWPEKEKEQT